jgi:tetratricopeptide (TPR) repeat protein
VRKRAVNTLRFVRLQAVVATLLVVAIAVPIDGRAAQRANESAPAPPEWLQRLSTWSSAVTDHTPGASDLHLVELAAWSADDVKSVVEDYLGLRRQLRGRGDGAEIEHKKYRVKAAELRTLAVFTAATEADANAILRRAAVVHADVALLAALDWSRSTGKPDTIQVIDGVVVGYDGQSAHWIVARQLLDVIEPSPEGDPFVASWYNAVATALLENREFSSAKPHLEHALDLLPRDAGLRYRAGCYHQATAGPALVSVLRMRQRLADRTPKGRGGITTEVESPEGHWKNAEKRFREAVTLDPGHIEARIRLGQTLLQLDRPDDAAVELRRAAGTARDGDLGYLVHLLLGQAEERAGRWPAAAACYERAAAIVPDARSPRLALAALARRAGDRDGAWHDLQPGVTPPVPRQIDVDPWWRFFQWQSVPSKTLLDRLRASLAGGVRP